LELKLASTDNLIEDIFSNAVPIDPVENSDLESVAFILL